MGKILVLSKEADHRFAQLLFNTARDRSGDALVFITTPNEQNHVRLVAKIRDDFRAVLPVLHLSELLHFRYQTVHSSGLIILIHMSYKNIQPVQSITIYLPSCSMYSIFTYKTG